MLESLSNKVQGLRPATLLKKISAQVFFYEICKFLRKSFFHRTSPVAASGVIPTNLSLTRQGSLCFCQMLFPYLYVVATVAGETLLLISISTLFSVLKKI